MSLYVHLAYRAIQSNKLNARNNEEWKTKVRFDLSVFPDLSL
jgi:hypothetical protein